MAQNETILVHPELLKMSLSRLNKWSPLKPNVYRLDKVDSPTTRIVVNIAIDLPNQKKNKKKERKKTS